MFVLFLFPSKLELDWKNNKHGLNVILKLVIILELNWKMI
jgi:hypothetical protein